MLQNPGLSLYKTTQIAGSFWPTHVGLVGPAGVASILDSHIYTSIYLTNGCEYILLSMGHEPPYPLRAFFLVPKPEGVAGPDFEKPTTLRAWPGSARLFVMFNHLLYYLSSSNWFVVTAQLDSSS